MHGIICPGELQSKSLPRHVPVRTGLDSEEESGRSSMVEPVKARPLGAHREGLSRGTGLGDPLYACGTRTQNH